MFIKKNLSVELFQGLFQLGVVTASGELSGWSIVQTGTLSTNGITVFPTQIG